MRHYVPLDMNADKKPEAVRKLEICVRCGVPRKDWVRGGGCQLEDAKKWGAHYDPKTMRPREDIIAELDDPDPTITNENDAKRFSELTKTFVRLEMEKQAVQHGIDKIQGNETAPGPLLSIIQTYGRSSNTHTTFETFLVHNKTTWTVSGCIQSKIDDELAVKLMHIAKAATSHKDGSELRAAAITEFKSVIGPIDVTDKQLWTQIEALAVMYNSNAVEMREVVNEDVWNSFERDKDFKFPSVLKCAKKETRTFTITHTEAVNDVKKREKP